MSDEVRDPFGDDIVTSPRDIERAVAGLNDDALDEVVARFQRVVAQPTPRLGPAPSAVLVVSPEAGYGKSHLIGRLFKRLDDDATLIYLRPFQDASSCWVAILEKVLAELEHPDAPDKLVADPGEPLQIDTLLGRFLATLVRLVIEDGRLTAPTAKGALAVLREQPEAALSTTVWAEWLREERTLVLQALDRFLREMGVELRPSRRAWLKLALAYLEATDGDEARQLCMDWLAYRPLDREEGKELGLNRGEIPESELPYEQRNEKCFERLADLFVVGSFYRPFLLCFDQTELYSNSPDLARSFGVVVSRLRREAKNHLVLVTANADVWVGKVRPAFDLADADAFDPTLIELAGITASQAEELIQLRFAAWDVDEDPRAFARPWLPDFYRAHTTHGVRRVLRKARAIWSGQDEQPSEQSPTGQRLDEVFRSYRAKLLASPKGLDYDPGVFQWAVENVLGPALDLEVRRMQSPKGYFTTEWRAPDGRREIFNYERGNHWKRWEAILAEARRFHLDPAPHRSVRASLFRVPRQKPLSKRTQSDLKKSAAACRPVPLAQEQTADLFAAHDFIADIKQGNQEFSEEQVLAFLRKQLEPTAQEVWRSTGRRPTTVPPSHAPTPRLVSLIEDVVRRTRFITIVLLRKELPEPHREASDDEIVTAASAVPRIKVHAAPNSRVFQWLP